MALVRYASDIEEDAVSLMQDLVAVAPHQKNLAEDYAVITYNLARQLRQSGALRSALAYLLQRASLDAQIAARASFAVMLDTNQLTRIAKRSETNWRQTRLWSTLT